MVLAGLDCQEFGAGIVIYNLYPLIHIGLNGQTHLWPLCSVSLVAQACPEKLVCGLRAVSYGRNDPTA